MNKLKNWLMEKQSAYLYEILAKKESTNEAQLFNKLAQEAEKQANIWAEQIIKDGEKIPQSLKLNWRTKIVALLINMFGAKPLMTILAATKVRGLSIYTNQLLTHDRHKSIHEIGKRHHKTDTSNNLRAAVFGANDGLVSNSALIFGMMGAVSGNHDIILISGVSGLLAGAFSMATGEYISVRTQRELFEYQIGLEAEELKLYPEEEAEELALIFNARGLDMPEATKAAQKLIQDPERALDTLAKEELGIDPSKLASPWHAAFFSFFSFAIGAFLPLLPLIVSNSQEVFKWSAAITALSLFSMGAFTSLFTGKGALRGAFRMLVIGLGASFMTYLVGSTFNDWFMLASNVQ